MSYFEPLIVSSYPCWMCLGLSYVSSSQKKSFLSRKKERNKQTPSACPVRSTDADGFLQICLIYPAESFGMRKSQPRAFSVMLLLSTWLMCVGGSLSPWFRGVEECPVDDGNLSPSLQVQLL